MNLAETGFGNHFLRALVVAMLAVAVLMAFSTGEAFRPGLIGAVVTGAGVGGAVRGRSLPWRGAGWLWPVPQGFPPR